MVVFHRRLLETASANSLITTTNIVCTAHLASRHRTPEEEATADQ